MLQGWGKARPPSDKLLEAHRPEKLDKTAGQSGGQLKEDGHPRPVTAHLPAHKGRRSVESQS